MAVFRILFGAIVFAQAVRFSLHQAEYFRDPYFHFPFIEGWPVITGLWIYLLLAVIGLAALGICLGLFYRISTILFFLGFTYFFLMDKVLYNNHYYLIILIAFLLIFMDAHSWASLDVLRKRRVYRTRIPSWNLLVMRLQFCIVYFFGAIAKLNGDWLHGEPVRHWLELRSPLTIAGLHIGTELATWILSYGGLLFDFSIGFLLLWRRTRLLAFAGVLIFNLTNGLLFQIGVFPFLMVASLALFAEPDWPVHLWQWLRGGKMSAHDAEADNRYRASRHSGLVYAFVATYLLFQVLVPLRHWLYPGDVNWTEEGHCFAWRMKLREKDTRMRIRIIDPETGKRRGVDYTRDLSPRQVDVMSVHPDMILQYVHYLKRKAQAEGIGHPIINVQVLASLNFRPPQNLIDPSVNLADIEYPPFEHATWVTPDPDAAASLLPLPIRTSETHP